MFERLSERHLLLIRNTETLTEIDHRLLDPAEMLWQLPVLLLLHILRLNVTINLIHIDIHVFLRFHSLI